jgi:hypothetical protein
VSTESDCQSEVPEDAVNNGSFDEDGRDGQVTTIVLRAIADGQITAPGLNYILLDATAASYRVEMIVTDNEGATDSCEARVNVIDPYVYILPSLNACFSLHLFLISLSLCRVFLFQYVTVDYMP